jgi:acetyl esterase/lipase
MLLLRERAVPLPAASALLSPWLDLALTGPSLSDHAAADPLVSREGLLVAANHYLAGENPTNPLASPLYADLHGLPPLLIHVGGDEALLSDTTRFTERAEAAGVDVGVEVWEGMWHFWHTWAGTLPEGQQALDCIGAFVRRRLAIIQNPKSKIQNRTTLPAQSR